MRTLLSNSR